MGEKSKDKMTELPSQPETLPLGSSTAHFVLVHGVSHGAWCWYKVQTLLEGSGHKVTSLDLKASGTDPSDANTVVSFHDYNMPLLHYLSSLPNHHKVILVGHSAGGLSVTEAIHKFPHKIKVAVYIGATMLKLGFQSQQDLQHGSPNLSKYGEAYEVAYGLGVNKAPTSGIIKKELQRKILYQMSPIEDCTVARILLRPFPMVFSGAKFKQGEAQDSEKVERIYIKTLQDRVLKDEQQDEMIKRWPPTKVHTIDTDHSPFFSNPSILSSLLLNIASTTAK